MFYYCGDSYGEGGSNQRWLEPVLFHSILANLLDGGIIVTDGSNCGYYDDVFDIYAPWNALCGKTPFDKPIKGTTFHWANRNFICLGKIDCEKRKNVWAWQVSST